ncbi:sulfhydryl oxidase [Carp edema virus]|nr:sulfhydryl oxidase [Carp edema virus]
MDPVYWGYGTWLLIFMFIDTYKDDVEKLKKILWIICNNLPCQDCVQHIRTSILSNNILSETDYSRIRVFFIMVYNLFQEKHPTRKIEI